MKCKLTQARLLKIKTSIFAQSMTLKALFTTVCLFLVLTLNGQEQVIATIDVHKLRSWAEHQHSDICRVMYEGLLDSSLQAWDKGGVQYNTDQIRRMIK